MTDFNFESELWHQLVRNNEIGHDITDLQEIGSLIWHRGWSEANAGNVSFRLPASFTDYLAQIRDKFNTEMSNGVPENPLLYDWYLVSASGSRYREFKLRDFHNFVICGVDKELADDCIPGNIVVIPDDRKPTSEWQAHIAVQNMFLKSNRPERIVLHAHPTNWIVLSSMMKFIKEKQAVINALHECLPELKLYLPEGLSFLPYLAPGSNHLAEATLQAMTNSRALIWEKHGVIVAGDSAAQAFDYLELVSKAADVYLELLKLNSLS